MEINKNKMDSSLFKEKLYTCNVCLSEEIMEGEIFKPCICNFKICVECFNKYDNSKCPQCKYEMKKYKILL